MKAFRIKSFAQSVETTIPPFPIAAFHRLRACAVNPKRKENMKTQTLLLCMFFGMNLGQFSHAQTPFRNLNFEMARVSGFNPGMGIPVEKAFPFWTVDPWVNVGYDGISLGGVVASICDSNINTFGFSFGIPLEGKFSAFLFGGNAGLPEPATLSQTATVPSYANSLQMRVGTGYFENWFSISLGGQTLNMVPIGGFQDYTIYAGDISALAGQVATLSLTAPAPPYPELPSRWFLVDDIAFSPQIVPEPEARSILVLGIVLIRFTLLFTKSSPADQAVATSDRLL